MIDASVNRLVDAMLRDLTGKGFIAGQSSGGSSSGVASRINERSSRRETSRTHPTLRAPEAEEFKSACMEDAT